MFDTITMIDYRRPLAKRREARKVCGPYQWKPAKPNTGRGFYMASKASPLRMDEAGSCFRLRVVEDERGNSWSYDDGFTEFHPIVLRLPHGRGFLAGWTMGAGMCASVDSHIWEDEDEAMRAARDEAESACEREAEAEHEDD